jgi:hypothetical protein
LRKGKLLTRYLPGSAASEKACIRISASWMRLTFVSTSSKPYERRMMVAPKKLQKG